MALYPTITIDPVLAASEYFNNLPSGTLALIPLDMRTVMMTEITIAQASLTQDYSLRGWVSAYPDGMSVVLPPANVFAIMRTGGVPIVVHTASQTPPDDCIAVVIASGQYYLNVLNLTNAANVFAFTKTDLA